MQQINHSISITASPLAWSEGEEKFYAVTPCSRKHSVPGQVVWGICAESLGAGHGRMLCSCLQMQSLGHRKPWSSCREAKCSLMLLFTCHFQACWYLCCLNLHSVFHKNVLARNLSLSWVYWKPALKVSINSYIFMKPFTHSPSLQHQVPISVIFSNPFLYLASYIHFLKSSH